MDQNITMQDKNKSQHKLAGLPHVYYINLDGQPERRQYVEEHFAYWGVENYTRISGYDGREDDLSDILKGKYPDMMTSGEVGCTTSHLKALKYFIETSDAPCALIMEDDIDLQTARFWNFTWKEFYRELPYDWDIVQLAIIQTGNIHATLHRRFINDFSTAAYLVSRKHAQKLVDWHVRGDRYKIDQGVKPRAVADDLVYNSGVAYAIPLFLYKIALGSSIHPEHIGHFHERCYSGLLQYWETTGFEMDISKIMNYNPYLARVSSPTTDG